MRNLVTRILCEDLENLSYQEWCNLLHNSLVLVARHIQYKVELFFEEIIPDGSLEKQNMLYVLNFKKRVVHMSIHSYGFSMHQMLKIKLPTLSLLQEQ